MLLRAALLLLLRATTATVGCDGSINVPEECLFGDNTLSYCECNFCQTYATTDVYSGTPSLGPGISTTHILPGVQSNHSICLYHWTFFKVPTTSPGHNGENEKKGVVFYLDTEYKPEHNRFTTVDVLELSRGSLPNDWAQVHSANYPRDVFAIDRVTSDGTLEGDGVRWVMKQDSYMFTSGYDEAGDGCRGAQKEFVYFGVRCGDQMDSRGWVWPDQPCKFNVRLEHLPYELRGGDAFEKVPIQPGTTHFYWMHVGDYDVVRIHFARQGNNLTASTNDPDCPGCVQSNGHGLIGALRFDVDSCPSAGHAREDHALGNGTTELTLEWFCTQGGEGGRYTLGLEAAPVFDPSGGAPGYEYPDGSKAAGMPAQLEQNRIFNPGGNDNQLRAARGLYRISVFHLTFTAGPIAPGERRSGCISYGHWRHFTLVTEGVGDASLVAKLEERTEDGEVLDGMPLSALYVRRNKRPDAGTYDARAQHPTDELVLSPCDLHEPRQWHLGVHLDFELKANSMGLYRGYFVLHAVTESGEGASYSSAEWPQPGAAPRRFVLPRAEGGTGHTCCGQTKLWLLRDVPADVQLQVDVQLLPTSTCGSTSGPNATPTSSCRPTSGRARALLLNRGVCPSVSPGGSAAACTGLCGLTQLVSYDPYTRGARHALSASVLSTTVPSGAPPVADWLVGVQALDTGEPVEMSLLLSSRIRDKTWASYACGRLAHFCPQPPALENVSGYTRELPTSWLGSGATSAASPAAAAGWPVWMAAMWAAFFAARCRQRLWPPLYS